MEERQKRFGIVDQEIGEDLKLKKRIERFGNAENTTVKYYLSCRMRLPNSKKEKKGLILKKMRIN